MRRGWWIIYNYIRLQWDLIHLEDNDEIFVLRDDGTFQTFSKLYGRYGQDVAEDRRKSSRFRKGMRWLGPRK